jgi:hypothetical protein
MSVFDGDPAGGTCEHTFQWLDTSTMRVDVSPGFTSWKLTSFAMYTFGCCKASFALSACMPTTSGIGVPGPAGRQPAADSAAATAAMPTANFLGVETVGLMPTYGWVLVTWTSRL